MKPRRVNRLAVLARLLAQAPAALAEAKIDADAPPPAAAFDAQPGIEPALMQTG